MSEQNPPDGAPQNPYGGGPPENPYGGQPTGPSSGQPPPYPPGQPYGQPPGQPYGQPPGQPYGQPPGQYPPPYTTPPTGMSATKIVLIVLGVVLVLTCGGCFAVGALIVNAGEDVARELEEFDAPGPVVRVEEGAEFELDGLVYEAGWSVADDGTGTTIEGLTVRNDAAEDEALVGVGFDFYRGQRLIGSIVCTGAFVGTGERAPLDCPSGPRQIRNHDGIMVQGGF